MRPYRLAGVLTLIAAITVATPAVASAQFRGLPTRGTAARLLLGQPVQAAIEFVAVLVEERLELGADWQADDVLSERRWQ